MYVKIAIITIVTVLAALLLLGIPIKTNFAFVNKLTGSRYGYTTWIIGTKTNEWEQLSLFEKYVDDKKLSDKNWVSYAGTTQNIYGQSISHSHGRPGPIMMLEPKMINEWSKDKSQYEIQEFMFVLQSGEKDLITERIEKVYSELYE